MPASFTPAQLRGARGLLDWSMLDLARAARVSVSTIKRMEMGGAQPISDEAYQTVRAALDRAGVGLLADDGWGAGIVLRG